MKSQKYFLVGLLTGLALLFCMGWTVNNANFNGNQFSANYPVVNIRSGAQLTNIVEQGPMTINGLLTLNSPTNVDWWIHGHATGNQLFEGWVASSGGFYGLVPNGALTNSDGTPFPTGGGGGGQTNDTALVAGSNINVGTNHPSAGKTVYTVSGTGGGTYTGTNVGDMLVWSGSTYVSAPLGQVFATGKTTNATDAFSFLISMPSNTTASLVLDVSAAGQTNSTFWCRRVVTYRNNNGVISTIGLTNEFVHNPPASPPSNESTNWSFTSSVSGSTNIQVSCFGDATETVNWACQGLMESVVNSGNSGIGCVAPSISSEPVNVTCITNTTTHFAVTASGTSLAYQWQTNNGSGGYIAVADTTHFSGSQAALLWISNVTQVDSNLMARCVITNSCGSITSTVATLTVTNGTGVSNGLLTGLVSVWDFNVPGSPGDNAATNIIDVTDSGHWLTNHGVPLVGIGHIEGTAAVQLGSTKYYDEAEATFITTGSWSMSMWFKNVSALADNIAYASRWNPGKVWALFSSGNNLVIGVRNAGDSSTFTATSTINVNDTTKWHLVVFGFDSGTAKAFISVDGETIVLTATTDGLRSNADIFTVGDFSGGSGSAAPMDIDESAYWNATVITQAKITAMIGTFNFGTQTGTPLFYSGGGWN